jgi:hypothetical protein
MCKIEKKAKLVMKLFRALVNPKNKNETAVEEEPTSSSPQS